MANLQRLIYGSALANAYKKARMLYIYSEFYRSTLMKLLFSLLFAITIPPIIGCSPKETLRPGPKAVFTWENSGEGTIQFKNESAEGDAYEWTFGDVSAANTDKNPKHTYSGNGTYSVKLTVKNPTASDLLTKEIEISTIKPAPNFTWANSNGLVIFTNSSIHAESYVWDFGNGKTSTEPNPTQHYSKAGTYYVKLTATGKGGNVSKTDSVPIPVVKYTMANVVDDQSLVNFLPGVWGVYVKGEGNKYDNYTYRFSPDNNILAYQDYYQPSVSISGSPETARVEFKYSIVDNTIYVEDATGKKKKHARFQIVSDDEMNVFRIFESGSSLTEQASNLFTKTSDVEKPLNDVVKSQSALSVLQGVWDQGKYAADTDVFFDFSAGKNYYTYYSTYYGKKKSQKVEFKIDANNIMSYRNWNSDFDPAWKKYKVELVSKTSINFYPIDAHNVVNNNAGYMLNKRN
ncbi:PKD domain-containing protein [Spirosoma sp. BT702]|uniref:PKD domain-containing protein n=1 Tax=Spirosoma profusum TaxID=2771354 RepID=A0A926Y4I3_9BACT|nr:PKD domain-containing protein [Spirosoma profusum]MBD2703161.1 PKD domain-containing protein [Spirosoma profusum]